MPTFQLKRLLACTVFFALGVSHVQAQGATEVLATRPALSGERLFLQCRACHSLTSDQGGKVGPALAGLFARGVGRYAGYDYSPGMRAFGGTWSDERLSTYLAGPNRAVAGTKMAFAGIPDENRRAALIAYLRTATSPTPKAK